MAVAFYKYQNLGLIPCEITFTVRNKTYSTIGVMNMLAEIKSQRTKGLYLEPLQLNDWFDDKLIFNKSKFIELVKTLQALS